ncbi:MAG TPA: sugar-binding protein [bacterium]|nr:sugar-binding protein [bacterium]
MKIRSFILFIFVLPFIVFSEISIKEENDFISFEKGKTVLIFNKKSAYGTVSINLDGKKICEIVPGFTKLYTTKEKDKYEVVNYWLPTGVQNLEYYINRDREKVELIIFRNFPDISVIEHYTFDEKESFINYVAEIKREKEGFSLESNIYFNLSDSKELVWEQNKTTPELLGDYWEKSIEIKNSRWLIGYNAEEKNGLIIIRDYDFDPDAACHHFRIFRGPTLGIKITQRDFLSRISLRIGVFENEIPLEVVKKINLTPCLPSQYSFVDEQRVYPMINEEEKIEIDGKIEEEIWKKLKKENNFYKFEWNELKSPYFADAQTEFYGFYDKENIYLAVKCYEPEIKNLEAEEKTGSQNVWRDDCIELFIQPKGKDDYYQFIINPKGEKQDNKGIVKKWKANGYIGNNFWSIEVVIPFSILGCSPVDLDVWKFNICRERRHISELSSWNETSGTNGFHQPEKFGEIIFSSKIYPTKITLLKSKDYIGIESEIINMENILKEPLRILVSIPDDETIERIYQLNLKKGGREFISLFEKANVDKGYNINFDITPKIGIPLYSKTFKKTGYSGLISRLWPLSYDKILYIKENTIQQFAFIFANYTNSPQNFNLRLEVPKEIELLFLDRQYNFSYGQFFPLIEEKAEEIDKEYGKYKKYELKFSKPIPVRTLPSQEEEKIYERLILPFSIGKTNLKEFKIYFHIENNEKKIVEKENEYLVKTVAEFNAKMPKSIESGVFADWYFGPFQASVKEEKKKELVLESASSWEKSGFNILITSVNNKEIRDELNKKGFRIRTSLWWFWWDKEYLEKHPESYAITFNGDKAKYEGIDTVCPTLMIEDEEAFLNTKKMVQKLVTEKGNDIWHDTEGPNAWEICFCDRCIKSFRKYAGIDEKEELTPLLIKSKYKEEWREFASWQQAQIFLKIKNSIKQANPDARFANYGGIKEPDYRCNWEILSKYNSIDIAGPSMYELSPLTLKYWEKEMENFRKRVGNLKVTPWLDNEARQRNYKLLRTQALKSITIGCDGYHIYYDTLISVDGRRLFDLGVVNTIISDFEDFFLNGKKIQGEIFIDENKDDYSIDGWEIGEEKVIFIFNHDDKNKKEVEFSLPFEIEEKIVFYDYMNKKNIEEANKISLSLYDLGIKIIYIGPEEKLKERIKIWGNNLINFYKE